MTIRDLLIQAEIAERAGNMPLALKLADEAAKLSQQAALEMRDMDIDELVNEIWR